MSNEDVDACAEDQPDSVHGDLEEPQPRFELRHHFARILERPIRSPDVGGCPNDGSNMSLGFAMSATPPSTQRNRRIVRTALLPSSPEKKMHSGSGQACRRTYSRIDVFARE